MSEKLRTVFGAILAIGAAVLWMTLAGGGTLPATGAEEPAAEPPAAAEPSPGELAPQAFPEPLPLAKCDFCDPAPFTPRFGVVCTFADQCQPGANGCCEYNCECGEDPGNYTTPANACALDLPTDCCPDRLACRIDYCPSVGFRCRVSGCKVGCCTYNNCFEDPTCTSAEAKPEGAC